MTRFSTKLALAAAALASMSQTAQGPQDMPSKRLSRGDRKRIQRAPGFAVDLKEQRQRLGLTRREMDRFNAFMAAGHENIQEEDGLRYAKALRQT